MKYLLLNCALLLGLLAGAPLVRAQCVVSPPTVACPQPIRAIDVATGQEVQALCVGRAVRFEPGCNRTVDPNRLYYNALSGVSQTPAGCDFLPGRLANNTFTPSVGGTFSIAELSYAVVAGVPAPVGVVYVRNFQVYDSRLVPDILLIPCTGGNIYLNLQGFPANSYDQYFVQVNGGPLITYPRIPPLVVAAAAGSQVTIIGAYQGNNLCSNQIIKTVPSLNPQPLVLSRLEVQAPLPGPATLTFSGFTNYYINSIQRADPGSTRFRTAVVVNTPTTSSFNPAAPGLYRLARYDACGLDSAFSAPVPTLSLSAASANNVNQLSWQAAGPVASYTVLRNGTALATLPASATTYTDAAVACGTTYTYRLQGTTASGALTLSNSVPVQTVSALAPPTPVVNASFDLQNRLTLTATLPTGAALPGGSSLAYSRQGGPGSFTFAAVPTATDTLRDPTALADLLAAPPCYTAALLDVCGNTSPSSLPTCPALLTAEAADPDGLTARLSWSAFQGPGSPGVPVSYRVLTLASSGAVLAASAPTTSLTYFDPTPPTDRQVLRYRVEASGAGLPPGTVSYSNVATVTRRPTLTVPNAFTPNSDGLNDVLEVKGRYLTAFTFVVVDRNGQEVFRATNRSQTWDGTIRGHAPVNAAYVWRFTMQDEAGQPFTQTGSVSILR